MQKVLIVITKSAPFGGAQRYVYDVATGLPKDQFDVCVALGLPAASAAQAGGDGPLKHKLEAAGISTVTIPHLQRDVSVLKEFRVFFFLLALLYRERPDILHLNSSKIGGLGVVAGWLAWVPRIIFTAHGFAFNEERPWVIRVFLRLLYWFMLVFSSKTILVSEGMRHDLKYWPVPRSKLTVIHHAISPQTFLTKAAAREALTERSPALARWLTAHPRGTLIGNVAELHHIKGQRYAIAALHELPETALAICGEGDARAGLEEQVHALGLDERVFFLGHVADASQYLHAFDIFLFPSLSETLGFALLEAGLAELPVVASSVGGIPDIVIHEETGLLVPPRDSTALATALQRLIDDTALQEHLATHLREHVAQTFSREHMLASLMRVYTK